MSRRTTSVARNSRTNKRNMRGPSLSTAETTPSARLGRRGVFFTLMAIIAVTLLMLYSRTSSTQQQLLLSESEGATTRITVMDRYVATFEEYASTSLETAGFFAMQNLSAQIQESGSFLASVNQSVRDCLNDDAMPHRCLNASQTINGSLTLIAQMAASNLSINTTWDVIDVWVTEEEPFKVTFWMDIEYNISDPFARWEVRRTVRTPVDMIGITDPLYAHEVALGTIITTRNFSRTSIVDGTFTNTTFTQFYANKSYRRDPNGTSVLDRFRGRIGKPALCCGIESVVHSSELSAAMMANPLLVNWSSVDWQLFNTTAHSYDCNFPQIAALNSSNVPDPYIHLDVDHIFNIFNLSTAANYTCLLP